MQTSYTTSKNGSIQHISSVSLLLNKIGVLRIAVQFLVKTGKSKTLLKINQDLTTLERKECYTFLNEVLLSIKFQNNN